MIVSRLTRPEEVNVLRGKTASFANLVFTYDDAAIKELQARFDRPDSLYLTATTEEGAFVGFCAIDSDWREPRHFFLREIFVMPEHQGKGLGKSLMTRCIDHARANGAETIVTQTAFENAPMRALCEKLGFASWENPEWKDGVTYKLSLQ